MDIFLLVVFSLGAFMCYIEERNYMATSIVAAFALLVVYLAWYPYTYRLVGNENTEQYELLERKDGIETRKVIPSCRYVILQERALTVIGQRKMSYIVSVPCSELKGLSVDDLRNYNYEGYDNVSNS